MKPDFLPEYGQMPLNGQYAALYRLFTNQSWRQVCDPRTKKALLFQSVGDAIKAAKEHVRVKLNPDLTSSEPVVDEDEASLQDVLGVQQWRASKIEERAENQVIRNRTTMTRVKVERKGEGRRRVGKKV